MRLAVSESFFSSETALCLLARAAQASYEIESLRRFLRYGRSTAVLFEHVPSFKKRASNFKY